MATSEGKVLNSCEVASDDRTTKVQGYCSAASKSEMSVVSSNGSSLLPLPAFFWLTTELAGTIKVGTLEGMTAVEGSSAVVAVPVWISSDVVDVVVGADQVVAGVGEVFMISQVCDGV